METEYVEKIKHVFDDTRDWAPY